MTYLGTKQEVFTNRTHADCMSDYLRFKNSLDSSKYQFIEHACIWEKDSKGNPTLTVVYRVIGLKEL
jgi:hypothetical protein